jgi:hypothetical protein
MCVREWISLTRSLAHTRGMQPVMYSSRLAKAQRRGWERAGENIRYHSTKAAGSATATAAAATSDSSSGTGGGAGGGGGGGTRAVGDSEGGGSIGIGAHLLQAANANANGGSGLGVGGGLSNNIQSLDSRIEAHTTTRLSWFK